MVRKRGAPSEQLRNSAQRGTAYCSKNKFGQAPASRRVKGGYSTPVLAHWKGLDAETMSNMHPLPCAPPDFTSWPQTLLQGSLAALIGGGALIFVWWLTQRAEVRRRTEDRTSESVAAVVQACDTIPAGGVNGANDFRDKLTRSAATIARAFVLFGTREAREHTHASLWAFEWAAALSQLSEEASNTMTFDELVEVKDRISERAADAVSQLTDWIRDGEDSSLIVPSEA